MDNFGKNLKTLRKKSGLTQQELAEKLGVRKTTISNYETSFSSPPKSVLVEIARFFDVGLDDLVGIDKDFSQANSLKSRPMEAMGKECSVRIFSTISSIDDIQSTKKLIDIISFSNSLPKGEYFGICSPDDSLSMRGINKGDYIIFKTVKEAQNGDIVAAVTGSEPAFFGIYHETKNEISILPAAFGGDFSPRFFSKEKNDLTILGIAVRAVINI